MRISRRSRRNLAARLGANDEDEVILVEPFQIRALLPERSLAVQILGAL
jgi:hypothetical protein